MTRYLCISVTFLDALFHGKGDDERPEWPPSPLRLFQALVAGTHAGCHQKDWSETKQRAFEWLEKRNPPDIVAPPSHEARPYTLFVPDNDSDNKEKFDRQKRLKGKLFHPHRILDGDAIHYLWRIEDTEWPSAEANVSIILNEATKLLALGLGIDMVIGYGCLLSAAEVNGLKGVRWHPREAYRPEQKWRVPREGTLRNAQSVYRSRIKRLEGKRYRPLEVLNAYGEVLYVKAGTLPPRPYVAFALEPYSVGKHRRAVSQSDIAKVAAMVRHTACGEAKRDSHNFPGGAEKYVAGHLPRDSPSSVRFSYLPLPSVGHPHADGMIRRVLIAEPYGGNGEHVKWAKRRLANTELIESSTEKTFALLSELDAEDRRMVRNYVQASKAWLTVTPVILPGFDDGKYEKALGLLQKAIQQAGLDVEMVEDANLRKAPFLSGSLHPLAYFRPDYLRNLPGWHVYLQFREPVDGPLAIGLGRHIGLGLFLPADTD